MEAVATLFFVDVRFSEDAQEVQPALLGFLHAFNSEHGNLVGFDFPSWSPGDQSAPQNALELLRLFGAKASLEKFIQQPRMARMASLLGCAFSLKPVPSISRLAVVSRNNTADKNKPGHARRLARRASERAGKLVEVSDLVLKRSAAPSLALPTDSKSTGQSFLLKLKKTISDAVGQVEFNSYGLCKAGAIPQF